jgi:hypothetical protein
MISFFRRVSLWGCAGCLLAGCSLAPKTVQQCGACVPPVNPLPLSTYDNYTPPPSVLKPLPEADAAPPPPEASRKPAESAQSAADATIDFFESSRERRRN